MRRRSFLGLIGALTAAAASLPLVRRVAAQVDRLAWWRRSSNPQVLLEWRYLAGRITEDGQDFGFVASIADYNIPFSQFTPQLLVMRQPFAGAAAHAANTYPSADSYDSATATYTYTATGAPASAVWSLDNAAPSYRLTLSSPELSLANLILEPVGALIPEGGDGEIGTAAFGTVTIRSDYYADWVRIRRGETVVGYGRLDMQTIKLFGFPQTTGFSHHWFAAAVLVGGEQVWVSAWRLVSDQETWAVTVARGSGSTWRVESLTEETAGVGFPLEVSILDYQPQPVASGQGARRTGQRWRLRAGRVAQGDAIDLEIGVAPGQFIKGARVAGFSNAAPMQEAISTEASGTVGGAPVESTSFAVAESTFSEPAPAGDERLFLPLLHS